MIDTLTIILSTTICLFVLLRAVRLDRTLPWFTSNKATPDTHRPAWTPAWDAAAASDEAPAARAPGRHSFDDGRRA